VLAAYKDVTPDALPPVLPPSRGIEHRIELLDGAVPRSFSLRRRNVRETEELRRQITELLKLGLIKPSHSPYGAPTLLVPKKDGSKRLVVDYRALNAVTKRSSYPLPLTGDLLDQTQGARWFSKIDLMTGFHQIRVAEGDREKTAFRTPFGHYEYNVMPMGLTNAPATFMQLMNDTFRDLLPSCVIVYLDDILIYSRTLEEHERHVSTVFERMRRERLYAKRSKCELFLSEVDFLGFRLGRDFVGTCADKVKEATEWPVPTKVADVRSFLGVIGFYRRFVRNFSRIAAPLNALTRKNAAFTWGSAEQTAFDALKAALRSQPVLRMADPSRPFVVATDASGFVIGAVLQQDFGEGLQPIEFMSKKMLDAETRYPTHEQEFLAIVCALSHWQHYLMGAKFSVWTDHQSLQYWSTQPRMSMRQARWNERLAAYGDFDIRYVQGSTNAVADGLSRRPDHEQDGAATADSNARSEEDDEEDLAAARADGRRTARQAALVIQQQRKANIEAATLTRPPAVDRPAPNAKEAIVMPTQRCTATTRAGNHCKQVTAKGQFCYNHMRTEAGLRVTKSTIAGAGMGLFAARPFAKGGKVAEYTGDTIDLSDPRVGGAYVLSTTGAKGIDAARTNSAYGRWANDPKGTRLASNSAFAVNRRNETACLRATKAIRTGSEILVPYGRAYWVHVDQLRKAGRKGGAQVNAIADGTAATDEKTKGWDVVAALRAAIADDEEYRAQMWHVREFGDEREARQGMLFYRDRICVPADEALRTRILLECHDTPTGGHLGRDKTTVAVKQRFYWRGIDAAIDAYVASCDECQRNKPSQERPMGTPMPLPAPASPWEQVTLDLITGLPPSSAGHTAIVVFVDKLSKMVHYSPTTDSVTAPQLAELFLRDVVRLHGFPRSLISDRDPRFTAHFWRSFWASVGTTLAMSTAYHPQSDGQTERANRTLETMLRSVVSFNQKDWHTHLPLAELAINSAVQASTGASPFSLVYGREAALPLDHALAPLRPEATQCPAAETVVADMRSRWERAQRAIERAGQRQAAGMAERMRTAAFAVGDEVLLSTQHLRLTNSKRRTAKFAEQFIGPFKVAAVVNTNAYTLDLPSTLQIHPTINIARLKRYTRSDDARFPGRPAAASRPPTVATTDNGAPVWEVAEVLARRYVRGKKQYLVSWEGYDRYEATWEPADHLGGAAELVEEFESGIRAQSQDGSRA
jgi:hypothetical protein